ncbi:MAG TPA: serine O-acetyltransferase, partial [Methylophaga sp.]|nr:serine O-acetyltransferase [Methylophaga sp.]
LMEKRMDSMCQTIHRLGGEMPDVSMPELEGCELDKDQDSAKVD